MISPTNKQIQETYQLANRFITLRVFDNTQCRAPRKNTPVAFVQKGKNGNQSSWDQLKSKLYAVIGKSMVWFHDGFWKHFQEAEAN